MKITHVNPESMNQNPAFSQAVVVTDAKQTVYIGEQNGVDAHDVIVGDDLASQVEQTYKNILEVLKAVGATQENVVKQTILVAKGQDIRTGYGAVQKIWGTHPSAITVHVVDGFGIPGALVGVEAICVLGE